MGIYCYKLSSAIQILCSEFICRLFLLCFPNIYYIEVIENEVYILLTIVSCLVYLLFWKTNPL